MKHFINRLKIVVMVVVATLVVALPAYAAVDIGLGKGGDANAIAAKGGYDTTNVTDTTLSQSVGKIIRVALSFVGTLFFALTIYAGFLWMTASGNEEQVEKAKSILKMAIIGMIISMSAYGITYYVLIVVEQSAGNTSCVGANCGTTP